MIRRVLYAFSITALFVSAAPGLSFAADGILSDLLAEAGQGDVKAQITLGKIYAGCAGVPCNGAEALKWYRKAAGQGSAEAEYNIGNLYVAPELLLAPTAHLQQDDAEAVKWWRKAAEAGYAPAQNRMGRVYENGIAFSDYSGKYRKLRTVVWADYDKAIKWYRLAANQGDERSQAALGDLYAKGSDGASSDPVQAYVWYSLAVPGYPQAGNGCQRLAAEISAAQLAEAQYKIGAMYEKGDSGTKQDLVQAYKWYSLGAQAYAPAAQARAQLAEKMPASDVAEGKRLATGWKQPPALFTRKAGTPPGLLTTFFVKKPAAKPPVPPVVVPTTQETAMSGAGVGDVMPDGTIYLGKYHSVRWFAMDHDAVDARGKKLLMTYDQAQQYARDLRAHSHSDWVIPDQDILQQMFGNQHKGSFKGTYSETANYGASWYWSSTQNQKYANDMLGQWFNNGNSGWIPKTAAFSVRCVRAVIQQ
jgi:TPR repeat protein